MSFTAYSKPRLVHAAEGEPVAIPCRVLMKDGSWLVPVAERPKGWERYELLEPTKASAPAPEPPTLDAVVAATEAVEQNTTTDDPDDLAVPATVEPTASKERTLQSDCENFRELKDAISLDAPGFGATEDIVIAAWVMVAGIWRRRPNDIRVMINYRATRTQIRDIGARFCRSEIWKNDHSVVLGEMDGTVEAYLEFWANAMVGAGQIEGHHREGEGMRYWAVGAEPPAGWQQDERYRDVREPEENR